ncbi:MAG: hypothetical protein KIT09_25695 [Bryobacteraceae bacterium]|nr:hypothetical protein [Bryobacteraceae bacterium]
MRRAAALLLAAVASAAAASPPAPESFFGHRMGADRKLAGWDQVVSYFKQLDAASNRVKVDVIGASVDGRPLIAATIAASATMRDLERYRSIQGRLADPRRTPAAGAEMLFEQGKAIVMITCSIHSTEVASTHTAIEFAHRMATASDHKTRAILDNTIFLLVPSLNPDGVEIVRRWYEKTLGTPYEGSSPPELYHRYLGHDNNRDWYIFSQPETRAVVARLHNEWHPQIVYDVHQQSPYASRMFVPPWMDPIEPNIDPILAQLCNMIGMGMAADLTAAGKTGVVVNALYDFWTPARHYQAYHGGARILSESASVRLATPLRIKPEDIRDSSRGYDPRQSSWNYLEPWRGGNWTLRDIVDYQLIAWESCLYQAAVRRRDLLTSFYRIGVRAVERTSPYAFVIPASQPDPGSAAKMLETLSFGLVEIERAGNDFEAGGRRYRKGDYVIRLRQPYGAFAKTLLERQDYPDLREYPGGPPRRPYDVTAHTLPLLMGVKADLIDARFSAPLQAVREFPFEIEGRRPAEGGLSAWDVSSWREVNRLWKAGATVWREGDTGDFHAKPATGAAPLKRPRLGLYRSYAPAMDEGWTRWLLEQFGFEYAGITNADIAAGGLAKRLDALVFPDQSESSIAEGYPKNSMPEEFTGGLGDSVAELKAFVEQGGALVFLNDSTRFAVNRLGLPVKDVVEGAASSEFYSPGSLLNVTLADHPLARGLPKDVAIWSQGSPAWETRAGVEAAFVARYPQTDILASGWLLGESRLAGQAALLEIRQGKGRIVLFGMRPQYRAQSYQAFKLFFNAIAGY